MGGRATRKLLLAAAIAALIGGALPALAGPVKTKLASKTSAGAPGDPGDSTNPSISATGRYIVFESEAQNLPGGGGRDIYVHDRKTGRTKLVSRTSSGEPAGGSNIASTLGGAISASGRFVVFASNSTNLPGNHIGVQFNVYRRDLKRGKTILVSKTSAGDRALDGTSIYPAISASGRFVAFDSDASNFPGAGAYPQIYVRDLKRGRTTLASKTSSGEPATGGQSVGAIISPTGRWVGFESNSTNLGGDDSETDVFVHDLKTHKTILISRNSAGDPATGDDSYGGSISKSGRFVAFESGADNLPAGAGSGFQVYVRDLKTRKTRLVSRNSKGVPGENSIGESLSANGRFVAFESRSSNFPGSIAPKGQAYLYDIEKGKLTLLSRNSAGDPGDDSSTHPFISANAGWATFPSDAANFPGGGDYKQIYVRGPLK